MENSRINNKLHIIARYKITYRNHYVHCVGQQAIAAMILFYSTNIKGTILGINLARYVGTLCGKH